MCMRIGHLLQHRNALRHAASHHLCNPNSISELWQKYELDGECGRCHTHTTRQFTSQKIMMILLYLRHALRAATQLAGQQLSWQKGRPASNVHRSPIPEWVPVHQSRSNEDVSMRGILHFTTANEVKLVCKRVVQLPPRRKRANNR